MVTQVSISTHGLEEFLDELVKAEKDIDTIVDRALIAAAAPILNEMRALVPKDTGNLLAHITTKGPYRDANTHTIEVGVIHDKKFTDEKTATYGNVVEYGSNKGRNPRAPRSYIRAAVNRKNKAAVAAMKRVFEDELLK